MTICAVASEYHYLEHLDPVARALPVDMALYTSGRDVPRGSTAIVTSRTDADQAMRASKIYIEHGSGQTYGKGHPGYPGGVGLQDVKLFLCPSDRVADAWRTTYPNVPAVAVGCPKMDRWHGSVELMPAERVVAITWHWDCTVSPWSGTAFHHYRKSIVDAVYEWRHQGWKVVGHGHPRRADFYREFWRSIGVPWWPLDQIFDAAHVMVADNTSAMWEFASLNRPLIICNDPRWSRNSPTIDAPGQRFWEWADAGLNVYSGPQLADVDLNNLVGHDEYAHARNRVVDEIYKYRDGQATRRAVEAILEHVEV